MRQERVDVESRPAQIHPHVLPMQYHTTIHTEGDSIMINTDSFGNIRRGWDGFGLWGDRLSSLGVMEDKPPQTTMQHSPQYAQNIQRRDIKDGVKG